MTTLTDRVQVTFSPATHKWLKDNFREQGYASTSKYVAFIVNEYVKTKTIPVEPEPEGPLTPQQEVDKVVEEIGNLTATYNEKFEAIRSLVPKDAPKMQTLEDLKKRIGFIWTKVIEKNGYVRGERNKVVPLSKNDVRCYESLCQLQLRKLELQRTINVVEVAAPQ